MGQNRMGWLGQIPLKIRIVAITMTKSCGALTKCQ